MQLYQKVLLVIGICALAFLSLWGVLAAIPWVGMLPKFIISSGLAALELGWMMRSIILVVFGFLFALSFYLGYLVQGEVRRGVISLKNPLGRVEVSQKAVCEFIQRVGNEVEGVEDLKTGIRSSEEGVDVSLALSTHTEGEIPRLIDELQTVIKNYLNNTIGVENVREIEVRVNKIL